MSVSEQLALPAGSTRRESHVLNLGTLLLGGAGAMVFGALLAAYLHLRGVAGQWPPEGVELDNYLGVMLLLTALLSAFTVEWAPYALKRGNQRQTLWALALTVGLGLAFLNLLWYAASQLGFGVADHAYGTLFYAAIIATGAQVVLGLGYVLVALVRTSGHQVVPGDHQLVRAAGWYWQWVNVCWLVAFTSLYVLHHR
jgi:cytochrome c oxidase subunit 3